MTCPKQSFKEVAPEVLVLARLRRCQDAAARIAGSAGAPIYCAIHGLPTFLAHRVPPLRTSNLILRHRVAFVLVLTVVALTAACAGNPAAKPLPASADTDLEFAGQMALRGNWREAIFRWEQAIAAGHDSSRVRNNLAVAYERLGEFDRASEEYEKALELGRGDKQIQENYRQFLRFYRDYKEREMVDETAADAPD